MIKIFIIFIIGLAEQALYTFYLLSVAKKQKWLSSILMILYMTLYLFIVAFAMKDSETISLLIAYALACGLGNFIVMQWETRKKINENRT